MNSLSIFCGLNLSEVAVTKIYHSKII